MTDSGGKVTTARRVVTGADRIGRLLAHVYGRFRLARSRLNELSRDGRTPMDTREAVVAVLRRGDRVLVIRRGPKAQLPGFWAPPSGRIEAGETQEEALVREVDEEVGLRVSPLAKVWECRSDDGRFLLHWWTAEAGAGEVTPDPREVSEARWVTAEEFLTMDPTFPGDREFFDRVLPASDRRDH